MLFRVSERNSCGLCDNPLDFEISSRIYQNRQLQLAHSTFHQTSSPRSSTMSSPSLILWPIAGLVFLLATFLGLSESHRQSLLRRTGIIRRLSLSSRLRPLTPANLEKQAPSSSSPSPSKIQTLKTTFPPSQRDALVALATTLPAAQRSALANATSSSTAAAPCSPPPTPNNEKETGGDISQHTLLRMDEDYRSPEAEGKYSYSGFSVCEIRALGEFPDYAALSGVSLPRECDAEFDIDRALPRPYRPLRWGYHQTMCKCCCLCVSACLCISPELGDT